MRYHLFLQYGWFLQSNKSELWSRLSSTLAFRGEEPNFEEQLQMLRFIFLKAWLGHALTKAPDIF